jgi:hypothetical protein
VGRRRSNRSNKGRPPVTADDNVGGRAPSQNKKCSVDAITNSDNEAANDGNDDEDDEDEYEGKDDNENEEDKDNTTPRKGKGKAQPDIDSPTSNRPRRRQQTNEAGDHVDASDEHDPTDIPVEYYRWFGTDKASHLYVYGIIYLIYSLSCAVPSAQSRTFISAYHNGTHPSLQRHAPGVRTARNRAFPLRNGPVW